MKYRESIGKDYEERGICDKCHGILPMKNETRIRKIVRKHTSRSKQPCGVVYLPKELINKTVEIVFSSDMVMNSKDD